MGYQKKKKAEQGGGTKEGNCPPPSKEKKIELQSATPSPNKESCILGVYYFVVDRWIDVAAPGKRGLRPREGQTFRGETEEDLGFNYIYTQPWW